MLIFASESLLIPRHLLTSTSGSEDLGLILENFKVTSGVNNPLITGWEVRPWLPPLTAAQATTGVRANPWLNGVASRRKFSTCAYLRQAKPSQKKCKYPYHLVIITPCKHWG